MPHRILYNTILREIYVEVATLKKRDLYLTMSQGPLEEQV